jgi:hypothetical protein
MAASHGSAKRPNPLTLPAPSPSLVDRIIPNVEAFFPMLSNKHDKRRLRFLTSNLLHLSNSTVAHVFVATSSVVCMLACPSRGSFLEAYLLVSVLILSRKVLDA